MKWDFKRDIFALSVITIIIIIGCYFYMELPKIVATHFNGEGVADEYGSKLILILPAVGIPIGVYLIIAFIFFIDPFKKKFAAKYHIVIIIRDIIITFAAFAMTLFLVSAKDGIYRTDLFGASVGILFIFTGNYLPKLPMNFFLGIKTRWTLASEEVWYRTHKTCGSLCILGGLLIIILVLLKVGLGVSIIIVTIPLFVYSVYVYPYLIYHKLQKESKLNAPE